VHSNGRRVAIIVLDAGEDRGSIRREGETVPNRLRCAMPNDRGLLQKRTKLQAKVGKTSFSIRESGPRDGKEIGGRWETGEEGLLAWSP